ncbi:MAG TPA: AarF/UbiB family protein [Fimbriiglobus sp.]|jgi:ubiquinone biosynthesis protein
MSRSFPTIPAFARHIGRVTEVVAILAKYGIADWVAKLDSRFVERVVKRTRLAGPVGVSHEARIRLALTELGTTYIKLGQMLSTRRDFIGATLADELGHLQAEVPADPFPQVQQTIVAELGAPVASLFASFDEAAFASASIGQCHRATLSDGRRVVVKVQHAGVTAKIEADLAVLGEFAALAEEYLPDVRPYRPVVVVREFRRAIIRELDFRRELRHLQLFGRNFAGDPHIRFPEPVPERSSGRVLTMRELIGEPLPMFAAAGHADPVRMELARRGAGVFLDMIFRDGFYHADPHPGNILVMPEGVIGLLDAGMVGRVDDRLRDQIGRGLSAVMANDPRTITELLVRVGQVPPEFEPADLESEVTEQLAFYWGMPLDQFQLGTALNEMTEAIRRFRIVLPAPLAMLFKVLVMLEGTARLLSPQFNLTEAIEPYRRTIALQTLSPRRIVRRGWATLRDWDELLQAFPRQLRDVLSAAHRREFGIRLEHHHLEPSVNRLVFGLITSSLFVGSSLLWASNAPPHVFGVSLFGVIGCSLGVALGYRLFRAIQKSGRLEDRQT